MAAGTRPNQRTQLGGWLYERLGLQGISYSVPKHANSLPLSPSQTQRAIP